MRKFNDMMIGSKKIAALILSAALTVSGFSGTSAFAAEAVSEDAVEETAVSEAAADETEVSLQDASVTPSTDMESAPEIKLGQKTDIAGMENYKKYYVKFTTEGQGAGYFQITFEQKGVDSYTIIDSSKNEICSYYSDENTYTSNKYGFKNGIFYLKINTSYSGDCSASIKVDYVKSDAWEAEYNNSADDATSIELNKEYYGNMYLSSYKDVDWYKFEVPDQATDPGYFTITLKNNNGEGSWYYELSDKNVHTVYKSGEIKQGTFTSPKFAFNAQTMYLKVYSDYLDKYGLDYGIEVDYTSDEHYEAEKNDTIETANELKVGEKKQGMILREDKDVDYYKINVTDAGNYHARFYHANGDMRDGWLVTLLDGSNSTLSDAVVNKSGETVTDTMSLSAGVYYIKVEKRGFIEACLLPYTISLEGNASSSSENMKTVTCGDYTISYNAAVPFFGSTKKLKTISDIEKVFGDIFVTANGTTCKATSVKITKKSGSTYIQIVKTDSSDKKFNKGVKKATKGTAGLQVTVEKLLITKVNGKSLLDITMKGSEVKKVKVKTNGPKVYKAKKGKDFDFANGVITFKGEYLEGEYKV